MYLNVKNLLTTYLKSLFKNLSCTPTSQLLGLSISWHLTLLSLLASQLLNFSIRSTWLRNQSTLNTSRWRL